MGPQNVISAAIVSTTTPDTNIVNGSLWYNPSTRDINIFVNNTWYPLFSSLINPAIQTIEQSYSSLQKVENTTQLFIQELTQTYYSISDQYNNQKLSYSNFLNEYNNLVGGYNNLLNQNNSFYSALQSNLLFYSSVSFQVLTGYYIYNFNFSNLYNSFTSAFGNYNFQVIGIITMPFQYYYQGANTTPYLNVNDNGDYAYYPLMYHVESDLIYNSSNQTGTFTVAIGPQGPGVSNLSQGLTLHDYAQDSSAEMYEIKFFAGPFNTSQQVTSNLSSDGYISQLYGNTSYKSSYVGSNATFNIFGYSIGIYL